jgi:hypothetical protein
MMFDFGLRFAACLIIGFCLGARVILLVFANLVMAIASPRRVDKKHGVCPGVDEGGGLNL